MKFSKHACLLTLTLTTISPFAMANQKLTITTVKSLMNTDTGIQVLSRLSGHKLSDLKNINTDQITSMINSTKSEREIEGVLNSLPALPIEKSSGKVSFAKLKKISTEATQEGGKEVNILNSVVKDTINGREGILDGLVHSMFKQNGREFSFALNSNDNNDVRIRLKTIKGDYSVYGVIELSLFQERAVLTQKYNKKKKQMVDKKTTKKVYSEKPVEVMKEELLLYTDNLLKNIHGMEFVNGEVVSIDSSGDFVSLQFKLNGDQSLISKSLDLILRRNSMLKLKNNTFEISSTDRMKMDQSFYLPKKKVLRPVTVHEIEPFGISVTVSDPNAYFQRSPDDTVPEVLDVIVRMKNETTSIDNSTIVSFDEFLKSITGIDPSISVKLGETNPSAYINPGSNGDELKTSLYFQVETSGDLNLFLNRVERMVNALRKETLNAYALTLSEVESNY